MGNETGYLRHLHACNPPVKEPFLPWIIEGRVVGWVRPGLAAELAAFSEVFRVSADRVELQPSLDDFESRSEALARVGEQLAELGVVTPPMGELYPVTPGAREEALCIMDRAVAAWFGVRTFGQHLNGFVRREDGLAMWIGRRARDRLVFPGRLDQLVAGGLPWGIGLWENLEKECMEEAGIPAPLARQAVPVGLVSYNRVAERGFRPDVPYCYDLELSADFEPRNTDGEVESFSLLPLEEVARLVRETDEFKLNCNLVIIDFLIRHGYLQPDEPEYLELVQGLRQPLGMARRHSEPVA
jgi:8-oxo-dGTP pyrophosphatase MutT (NUDIX family)